jgi:hypothetical protein
LQALLDVPLPVRLVLLARVGGRQAAVGRLPVGERGWIKAKNRDYWRYEMGGEGALKHRRVRQFV